MAFLRVKYVNMGLADYLLILILQKMKHARLCVFLLVWNMKSGESKFFNSVLKDKQHNYKHMKTYCHQ